MFAISSKLRVVHAAKTDDSVRSLYPYASMAIENCDNSIGETRKKNLVQDEYVFCSPVARAITSPLSRKVIARARMQNLYKKVKRKIQNYFKKLFGAFVDEFERIHKVATPVWEKKVKAPL